MIDKGIGWGKQGLEIRVQRKLVAILLLERRAGKQRRGSIGERITKADLSERKGRWKDRADEVGVWNFRDEAREEGEWNRAR